MFDYFATHKEPYPLKLETFRLMCGSDSTRAKKWREQVGEACDELRENGLVEAHGSMMTWCIASDERRPVPGEPPEIEAAFFSSIAAGEGTGHLVARTSSCGIVISGEAGINTVDHRRL
jgi:hypothetical protein